MCTPLLFLCFARGCVATSSLSDALHASLRGLIDFLASRCGPLSPPRAAVSPRHAADGPRHTKRARARIASPLVRQATQPTSRKMGVVFNGVVYVAGYLFLLFVAVCLASGLYYMAELVEEHTVLTRRLISISTVAVLVVHVLFMLFESLPISALAVGMAAHGCYLWLLQSFPFVKMLSPAFLASSVLLVLSHVMWFQHFLSHFHQTTHVLCFLFLNVWLVPFGFFISLSANESILPGRSSTVSQKHGLGI